MMKTFQGRTKTKVITYDGFSVMKEGGGRLFAPASYGCDCHGGILRRGVGAEPYLKEDGSEVFIGASGDVASVFRTQFGTSSTSGQEKLIVGQTNGLVYQIDEGTGRATICCDMGGAFAHYAVRTEERKNIHLFGNAKKVLITTDASIFTICETEPIFGCCALGGRNFIGLKSRTIKYSAPYVLNAFEASSKGGGALYLPDGKGEILSLQTDGEYLYVFMEKNIYRLTVGTDGMNFALENVEYFGGDICANSMLVTAKGIIFLAMSGIYLLRGKKAEQICKTLPVRPINAKNLCSVGYCDDMVLIDYKKKDENGREVMQRVVVSIENDNGYFIERHGNLGGNDMCVIAGVLYKFVKDSPNAQYRTAPYFKTGKLNFGTSARKMIKRLRLEGKGTARVYVQGEGEEHYYMFELSGGISEKKMLLSGNAFNVRIYPGAETELRSMQVEYSYMED